MPGESFSIECAGLTVIRGGVAALKDFSFCVEKHAWVYVMGPSGGGKTTLLRAIAGLEPAAAGEVRLEGRVVSDLSASVPPHERRVAMVFQESPLWPHLNVEANIALPLAGIKKSKGETRSRVRELMAHLHIGPLADKYPGEISGGETRRVAIAQALITNPQTLLLDEPTNHLDLHLRGEVMDFLHGLHGREGLTTVCVTHQPEPPLALSDRVCILEQGRVIHDGQFAALNPESESPFVRSLHRHLNRGLGT